jgi:predicted oxidoreductase
MRQSSGDRIKLQLLFLGRNCKGSTKFYCTITDYEARGQAFSKGGGNVTVPAFHVTWSRALARLPVV